MEHGKMRVHNAITEKHLAVHTMRARQARERSNGIWHATMYDAIDRAVQMEYLQQQVKIRLI